MIFSRDFEKLKGLFFALIFSLIAAPETGSASTADFFTSPEISNLVISPSGRYVAYENAFTGEFCVDRYGRYTQLTDKCHKSNKVKRTKTRIVIFDIQDEDVEKVVDLPENAYAGWIKFASDDRLLTNVVERISFGRGGISLGGAGIVSIAVDANEPANQEMVTLFEDNKKVRRKGSYVTEITNVLPDDPNHVLVPAYRGNDLDLWKVNVLTGASERIEKGRAFTFFGIRMMMENHSFGLIVQIADAGK